MAEELTNLQLDALREVSSISAGHAATSLSQMLNRRIEVYVPQVAVVDVEQVHTKLSAGEETVVAIYFEVIGVLPAGMVLVFPVTEAKRLAGLLLTEDGEAVAELDELALSALKELGNICAGSYLKALSQMVSETFSVSVPGLAIDQFQAVMDGVLIQLALNAERALVLETEFRVSGHTVRGLLLLLSSNEGVQNILSALKMV